MEKQVSTLTNDVVQRAKTAYNVPILTRKEWGSTMSGTYEYRRKNNPVKVLKADTLVHHITVTRPSGDFKNDMRLIEQIGWVRFKSGFSYNFGQDMTTGVIGVGQPLDAKGTHTINNKDVPGFSYDQNAVARAIAGIGMPETGFSKQAMESCAGLMAAMMDVGALTEGFDYLPHSFFAYKDCPCDPIRNKMHEMRQMAVDLRKKPTPVNPSKSKHIDDAIEATDKAIKAADKAPKKKSFLQEALSNLKSAKKL